MAKNVSGLNYETVYDNIPYHVKERVGFPMTSANLSNDQIRFLSNWSKDTLKIIFNVDEEPNLFHKGWVVYFAYSFPLKSLQGCQDNGRCSIADVFEVG